MTGPLHRARIKLWAYTAFVVVLSLALTFGLVILVVSMMGGSRSAMAAACVGVIVVWRLASADDTQPGVAVSRADEPGLWALVDAVCAANRRERVRELRLTFTEPRDLEQGIPPHRGVLILPLIYLATMTSDEFSVVVAWELDFQGRSRVWLDRWLAGVVRLLPTLMSVLAGRTGWYRALVADQIVARHYGAIAAVRPLRIADGLDERFQRFWRANVTPALESDVRPPIMAGFSAFLAVDRPSAPDRAIAKRVAALRADAPPGVSASSTAIALCRDLGRIEAELIGPRESPLRAMPWEAFEAARSAAPHTAAATPR